MGIIIEFPLIRHPNKRATALTYEHQKRTEALQFPLIRHPNKRATYDPDSNHWAMFDQFPLMRHPNKRAT